MALIKVLLSRLKRFLSDYINSRAVAENLVFRIYILANSRIIFLIFLILDLIHVTSRSLCLKLLRLNR